MTTHRGRAKQLSEEEVDAIVSRYQRGQSIRFICCATDHSHDTVKAALLSRGVGLRRRGSGSSNWGYTGGA
jgi:hypothetical protein